QCYIFPRRRRRAADSWGSRPWLIVFEFSAIDVRPRHVTIGDIVKCEDLADDDISSFVDIERYFFLTVLHSHFEKLRLIAEVILFAEPCRSRNAYNAVRSKWHFCFELGSASDEDGDFLFLGVFVDEFDHKMRIRWRLDTESGNPRIAFFGMQ